MGGKDGSPEPSRRPTEGGRRGLEEKDVEGKGLKEERTERVPQRATLHNESRPTEEPKGSGKTLGPVKRRTSTIALQGYPETEGTIKMSHTYWGPKEPILEVATTLINIKVKHTYSQVSCVG